MYVHILIQIMHVWCNFLPNITAPPPQHSNQAVYVSLLPLVFKQFSTLFQPILPPYNALNSPTKRDSLTFWSTALVDLTYGHPRVNFCILNTAHLCRRQSMPAPY